MMHDTDYRTRYARGSYRQRNDTVQRLRAYLLTRRTETWVFFAAGALLGAIIG